ncbi:MAG: ABC transporter permease [Spirochaetaceae bacterium]|nr:MAG: ABC transporter permease [Spirochaetaceae bacterium]
MRSRGFLLRLAVKNLTRYGRRTVITALAIAAGVGIYIAMDSAIAGFAGESDRLYAGYETGDVAVTAPGYWEERQRFPLDRLVADPQAVIDTLRADGLSATPRTAFSGELVVRYDPFPEDGSLQAMFYGIDMDRDADVFGLLGSIEQGRAPDAGEDGLLIGRSLADRLGAEVGFPVTVTTRTRDGFHQLMDLEITGIFQTPNPVINRRAMYMPIGLVDTVLEMQGAVTHVHTVLPGNLPADADYRRVERLLADVDGVEVLSFEVMNQEMAEIMEIEDNALQIILFLLGIIAVVGISNTMLMAVLEREREIGMMRAVGVRNSEIRRMFFYEAGAIGLAGSVVGIALGSVLVWLLVNIGLDYGFLLDGVDMDFRWDGVLVGVWNVPTMGYAAVGASLVAGLASMVPVRRILKKTVTATLRDDH